MANLMSKPENFQIKNSNSAKFVLGQRVVTTLGDGVINKVVRNVFFGKNDKKTVNYVYTICLDKDSSIKEFKESKIAEMHLVTREDVMQKIVLGLDAADPNTKYPVIRSLFQSYIKDKKDKSSDENNYPFGNFKIPVMPYNASEPKRTFIKYAETEEEITEAMIQAQKYKNFWTRLSLLYK